MSYDNLDDCEAYDQGVNDGQQIAKKLGQNVVSAYPPKLTQSPTEKKVLIMDVVAFQKKMGAEALALLTRLEKIGSHGSEISEAVAVMNKALDQIRLRLHN